jgi:benzoylformate decarboxylase/acetolactate synthase-1/2/3 large subunit
VNLQADGDLLYVVSGFYTAAHRRLPLLTVMFNNRSYGNDEEHQKAVAKARAAGREQGGGDPHRRPGAALRTDHAGIRHPRRGAD